MRSMTGYGRGTAVFDGRQIAVELSAVNRKQAEIALNLPRTLLELEPRLREEINPHLSRGRLTVAVGLHIKRSARSGAFNLAAAQAYREQLKALRKKLKLQGEITLELVLRGPPSVACQKECLAAVPIVARKAACTLELIVNFIRERKELRDHLRHLTRLPFSGSDLKAVHDAFHGLVIGDGGDVDRIRVRGDDGVSRSQRLDGAGIHADLRLKVRQMNLEQARGPD